jgi:hypothetical protein
MLEVAVGPPRPEHGLVTESSDDRALCLGRPAVDFDGALGGRQGLEPGMTAIAFI